MRFAAFRLRGDLEILRLLRDAHADGVVAVVGHQRGAVDALEELLAFEADLRAGVLRDDLAVVRVVTFDDLGDQLDAVHEAFFVLRDVDGEADLPLVVGDVGFTAGLQQAHQFDDRAGRQDKGQGLVGAGELAFALGEAAAVGRDDRQLAFGEFEEHAVEDVAVLVGGLRVAHFAQHVAEVILVDRDGRLAGEIRDRRELVSRKTGDLEDGTAGGDLHAVLAGEFDDGVAARKSANNGDEFLDRQGNATRRRDRGLDAAADAEIEVGGGQGDRVAFGFDEHVLEDRHRGAAPDDIGHAGEAVEKVIPVYLELHDDVRIEQRRGQRQPLIAHMPDVTVSILSSFINTSSISRGRKTVHSSARRW
ncbi:MAG: hypothetical protein AN484_25180 [Aphanizomenon flos-aquae WA102]|uniref:Uncharacterized protein n=1 Tax=Aphanizomenon flos-aquae WA102 TaxID=1710896 RepID=A0A1B7WJB5_APHFL|nr:MAG: hypothetical protein AN484_25180 [Aphanizomenon flos-aquae WA102]